MAESRHQRLLRLQKMEATEAEVYRRLALREKNPHNREVLEQIAVEEVRHQGILAEQTNAEVKPNMWKVWFHTKLSWLLGLTFAVKMLELAEQDAAAEYRELGLHELADDEESHEARLIGMLHEDRLKYIGSVVLGMSDALIELTGALAGLTFALGSVNVVALAGLVTGIAASFSMGASQYLSSRTEKKTESPLMAAFFTWLSYILTVFLLVMPYLVLNADSPVVYGLEPHLQALACTFIIGLVIVALFNFYISVVEEESFRRRFSEMAGILVVVSLISFVSGLGLKGWLGV